MSKRLQVLLPDQEMVEIQRFARREKITVGEWVRRVLREARQLKPIQRPGSQAQSPAALRRILIPDSGHGADEP